MVIAPAQLDDVLAQTVEGAQLVLEGAQWFVCPIRRGATA